MLSDLRQAWRMIWRMPGLAAVVIVSLGVGIGVNTAVFSWIQLMVLQPIPGVADAGGVQLVEPRADTGSFPGASWLEYRDLRDRSRTLPDLFAYRMVPFSVGDPGRPERGHGLLVSGNYFSALGLRPALGRFLRPDESVQSGGAPVVVISHAYWQNRFGGAATVLGQRLRVNDRQLTIVGVTPERFHGTVTMLAFDFWVPATMAPELLAGSRELEDRGQRGYNVAGRLAPRASRAAAQTEIDAVMRQLAHDYPETNKAMLARVLPFWQAPRGPQQFFVSALAILQGIMLLLLLAVCGNTANLMLARASARYREVGVRLTLGAGPWRVVSLLLMENLMLALLGSALGAAIAVWATDAMRAVPMITSVPVMIRTGVDGIGLTFALCLGLLSGLIFGVAPAVQLARIDPQAALRSGARTAGRNPMRNGLMAVEVALALVVLMSAGLFVRSFSEALDTDPGFRREGVLLAEYDLSGRNLDNAALRDFTGRLLTRLRTLPGVESAAIANQVPLDIHGLSLRGFTLEGRARPDAEPERALSNIVTADYFRTMGIPLRAGHDFAAFEDAAAPPQAIVNEEFVRRFLPDAEPLGRRLENRDRQYVITGVVRNSLSESFGEKPAPVIYFSYRDRPSLAGQIHLRTRPGNEALLGPEVERVVRELDPTLPVYDVRTLTDHIDKNLFLRRIPARMFVVLGPLMLVLAAIGIYAVVSYSVSRRTTEIGVRLALGATVRRVVSQIVVETLRVVGAGALAGWTLMFLVALHLLGGVISLPVFAGVPAVLLAVAAFASWLPARRATSVDVMVALRQE
jgi:macrolide transport system ATP-binding/permease protein